MRGVQVAGGTFSLFERRQSDLESMALHWDRIKSTPASQQQSGNLNAYRKLKQAYQKQNQTNRHELWNDMKFESLEYWSISYIGWFDWFNKVLFLHSSPVFSMGTAVLQWFVKLLY